MKPSVYISTIATACLLAAGCTKDVDIDIEDTDPQVVVMSRVTAGEAIPVRLTYSRYFLSTGKFRAIGNASIALSVNGRAIDTTVSGQDGTYTHPYIPQPGDRLGLTVRIPDHDPVTATTVVPRAADIRNLTATRSATHSTPHIQLRFTLCDPPGEDNYYTIRVLRTAQSLDSAGNVTYTYTHAAQFSTKDYMLLNAMDDAESYTSDEDENLYSIIPFTDGSINGQSHTIELSIPDISYINSATHQVQYSLEVTSYSKDRYLYEYTTNEYDDDDAFLSLFVEPTQIHSNINGGIGIFAAINRQVIDFNY